jgi:small GTP-binding protein
MAKTEETDINFKIVVVGESGVGKTNILTRYINDKFFVSQNTTIGIEFSTKQIDMDGKKVKVQLWDTAGQERYRALASVFYK